MTAAPLAHRARLVHGTRPLLRTVMEVGSTWALMSDGDSMLVWRIDAAAGDLLTVGEQVADHGHGRCTAPGGMVAYREADEEGDMRRPSLTRALTRASFTLAA
ncbi:hypothetical protein [Demequina mangrovi]|uniref:Uncharacterized protein n=1 Tax=Demequina mangrovi TaxID=1043493 RepID=A0A1H7ACA0_9MICO|nr:hypothetical protein [Demequina mangrovi]SEJ63018.1 hypothetical protein SAMN05421637_2478 [Demequina mangrovi]